jgi:DNA-directed RNA polymerase specialized sigma24 family protein
MALTVGERAAILNLRDRALREFRGVPAHVWQDPARGRPLVEAALTLLDPRATDDARTAAAERLVRDLPCHVRQPAGWRGWQGDWRDYAGPWGCSRDEALRRLLALGTTKALDTDCRRAQTVRLGKDWIKDSRGRKRLLRPVELPLPEFLSWLVTAAYKHATQVVGVRPRGTRAGDESETVDLTRQLEAAARAGAAALATRRRGEEATALLKSPKRPSDGQRRILQLLADGLTIREVAETLHVEESTVRVQLHRARSKQVPPSM